MDPWITPVLLLLLLVLFLTVRRPSGFPPGPLAGLLAEVRYSLSKTPRHMHYHAMMKDYGKVLGFMLVNLKLVIIGDYEVVKELFRRDEVTARPNNSWIQYRNSVVEKSSKKIWGAIWSTGKMWHTNRRFSLRSFRDLGFGKNAAQDTIHGQASHLVGQLSSQSGQKIFLTSNVFGLHVLNVIWAFLSGKAFNHDDPVLHNIAHKVRQSIKNNLSFSVLSYFPFMLCLFPNWTGANASLRTLEAIINIIKEELEWHEKTFDPDNIRDFMDAYLMQIRENKDNEVFNKEQLTMLALDFFLAGFETTTSTLQWAVLFMAMYPDVQEKVFLELESCLSRNVLPTMEDKKNLPYMEAVVSEVQRCGTIAPMAVPHMTTANINVAGYYLPKGTVVMSNLYSIHHDADYWKDPHVFRPERFLNNDQTAYVHHERLSQFGIGKRICLGESLARMEVFLFFAAMMQKLRFSLPEDEPPPSLERRNGITCAPKTCNVIVTVRDSE